jgi:hypothetical protein
MLMYSEQRVTQQWAKRARPFRVARSSPVAASRHLHGHPARAARRSLPQNRSGQSRRFYLMSSCSGSVGRVYMAGDERV